MIPTLIRAALRYRAHVFVLVALLLCAGVWATIHQKVEAYPDISGQMVQVLTPFSGRAPEEVERQVTVPIELGLRTVPRVETIRSRTIFGLSVVQLSFEEGVEGYWARQRVQEKLAAITLPNGATPELGPLATAYGEIYRYELVSDGTLDLTDLRTLNDWVVIPRLLRASGVAEVSNFGGFAKEFAVLFSPADLRRFDVSVADVVEAIQSNNATAGGSVVRRGSMSYVVRSSGALQSIRDIEAVFIKNIGGTPIYVRDIATVDIDHRVPSGIFARNDSLAGVEGIVLMRRGENPSAVLAAIEESIASLNDGELPEGATVEPFYDRSFLVNSTLYTVSHSVLLGITLVVLVLLAFLGRPAMALLVAGTIPFALLFAIMMMYLTNIPIGLLSIGAIDFGIIVDGAVIMAENIARRIGSLPKTATPVDVSRAIRQAAIEVQSPLFLSMFLIIAAYLPLLTLQRIEGLLFRPMALTMIFALVGALLFALFVVPAASSLLFARGYHEWHNPLVERMAPHYERLVARSVQHRTQVGFATFALVALSIFVIVPRLGTEFLPHMDEGVVWVRANFPEGTSLEQTSAYGRRLIQLARSEGDIAFASMQAGRNDSGTDPFPPSRVEMMVGPKPHDQWRRFHSKQEMLDALAARFHAEFPTTRFNFTQPIIDSVTEDTNGTSANLAIELSGKDPAVLQKFALEAKELLSSIPGARDVNIEQEGPQPQIMIEPDRALCARYNVRIEDVRNMIDVALGGSPLGEVYEEDRIFPITARFRREVANSPAAIGRLPVYTADDIAVPLGQVAKINVIDGQTMIARENGRRRLTVRTDIVGRDQGSFVAEAQRKFERMVKVPPRYRVAWLGMFQNLARAKRHFSILIPITIAAIFFVLLGAFRSVRTAFFLLLPIPFAFVGATAGLYARGMHFNVTTGVGLATVFAVALIDSVLLVRAIEALRAEGVELDSAIVRGRASLLRPALMTSLAAIIGLIPASIATGLGSDAQRPLATVIIWGLSGSTILMQFAAPAIYRLMFAHTHLPRPLPVVPR
ncbi:MAG: Cobalt-zinc-cadmium resistance protein CzcA [Myxococcaceae bacterium]|nr:Cobalt-zinc-cadmium resistance protein CzcA [Myxococcaceae bacterium]